MMKINGFLFFSGNLIAVLAMVLLLGAGGAEKASARYYDFYDELSVGGSVEAFELLDIYGIKGKLEYTEGCKNGKAKRCEIRILVPSKDEEIDEMSSMEDSLLGYVSYMSYLKKSGQTLIVRFEEMLTDSESEVAGYRVTYTTENKQRRVVRHIDSRDIPYVLKWNPLLLFAIIATHQSSLDLMLSPERTLYILSLAFQGRQTLAISAAGRGGFHGYRYYNFPKDNELFLDIGGAVSINGVSEGVGFKFLSNDKTQPPVRMVTGYHSDQKDWFINRAPAAAAYAALAWGFGWSIWERSVIGFVIGSLLFAVEFRAGAVSLELQTLARRVFPDDLQFNPQFQGRYLLKLLRS